jgi:hypothetical protein
MDLLEAYNEVVNRGSWRENYQRRIIDDQSSRVVAIMGRRTGKDYIIAQRALIHRDQETLILVPNYGMAGVIWDTLMDQIPQGMIEMVNRNREIRMITGRIIRVMTEHQARNRGTHGLQIDHLMVNEPGQISEETLAEIMTSLSPNGKVLMIGTPTENNSVLQNCYNSPLYSVHKISSIGTVPDEIIELMRATMDEEQFRLEANIDDY